MLNKEKLAEVLVVTIITLAFLVGINGFVQTIPAEEMPFFLEPYWNYIVTFFTSTPTIFVVALGRNILGYLRQYFRSKHQADYNIDRLYETWMLYVGGIVTVLAIIPKPYTTIAVAIIVLLDFVTSEIRKLKEPEPEPESAR